MYDLVFYASAIYFFFCFVPRELPILVGVLRIIKVQDGEMTNMRVQKRVIKVPACRSIQFKKVFDHQGAMRKP